MSFSIISKKESGGIIIATGGIIDTYELEGTTYKVHTFTSDDTFQITDISGSPTIDYLIVGGGGGGGYAQASGGAGGWALTGQLEPEIQSYSVIVGAGGGQNGTGGSSQLGVLTADGGPGGATNAVIGPSSNNYTGGAKWTSGSVRVCCGGGAGAGENADDATSAGGGAGGDGVLSNITGTNIYYAGGGGGGCYTNTGTNYLGGAGGLGGGGNGGGAYTNINPTSGTAGTGGGGGGGSQGPSTIRNGAAGGSGIVIVRYSI